MGTQLAVEDNVTVRFTIPNKYKVILLNDDQTPMEFVVELLCVIFNKSISEAEHITLEVHNTGRGIAGIYTYEVAEQKVHEAIAASRAHGFPLSFEMEEE
jgi:ATP-dependent Clp protease adaptor protein ClpS